MAAAVHKSRGGLSAVHSDSAAAHELSGDRHSMNMASGWRWLLLAVVHSVALWGTPTPAGAANLLPDSSGWPLAGPIRVLHGFAPPAKRWGAGHRGVDVAASVGQPVLAAAAGTVSVASRIGSRGVVAVQHGAVRTTYEPVSALVRVGDRVAQGAVIGTLQRGSHCGVRPCLHWGLRAGDQYLDPLALGAGPPTIRLLPASSRAVAQRRAANRMEAAARAARTAATNLARWTPAAAGSGFVRPVPGRVTSGFGMRYHPVLHTWKLHDGTDFGAGCGTPIRAPQAGRVVDASTSLGYGNRLVLDHGRIAGHQVRTGFNHATRYLVPVGRHVRQGEVIGYVGSTGFSTGCHLHLMLWVDGEVTNPMTWF